MVLHQWGYGVNICRGTHSEIEQSDKVTGLSSAKLYPLVPSECPIGDMG